MVWIAPKYRFKDYEELKEINVFNEKSLKAHLKFLTLVSKLIKAGKYFFIRMHIVVDKLLAPYSYGFLIFSCGRPVSCQLFSLLLPRR